jgi:hypothetical protein
MRSVTLPTRPRRLRKLGTQEQSLATRTSSLSKSCPANPQWIRQSNEPTFSWFFIQIQENASILGGPSPTVGDIRVASGFTMFYYFQGIGRGTLLFNSPDPFF